MENIFYEEQLQKLERDGLKRRLKSVDGAQDREINIDGRRVLNFCSNNYLGLANDPRLSEAAQESLKEEGFGSGASRLVCGNMGSHQRLEERIAQFKGVDAALVFNTGYMANVGIISAMFNRDDIIFSDRLNHASIVDGIVLSRAQSYRYPHTDMAALEDLLRKHEARKGKKVIITDSVFSMDGDIAPLNKIVALARRHQCYVMIDEAHAFGVLGRNGRGAAEHFGVEKQIDIQMGTLSKAAGSFGAYCCGRQELMTFIMNKARSFIYTTGMPPSVAAASIKAIELIETEPQRRNDLQVKVDYVRSKLNRMGFNTLNSQTPIIPVLVGDNQKVMEFSKRLFERGLFISAIRPPTVPQQTARLRITVMATHTQSDLDFLLNHIHKIGKSLCLL